MNTDALISLMNELIENEKHPLLAASIGIIRDGKVIFSETAGSRFVYPDSQEKLPADRTTKFRMASISKLLTATGIWQQIEKGIISPETEAGEILGFRMRNPNFPDIPVTIGMLLSHTSSIREGDDDVICTYHIPFPHTVREFFEPGSTCYYPGCWAGRGEEPGEFFSYCNFNYGLLGTILECVSGERFDKYMTNHVFAPLGLDCGFYIPSMTESAREHIGTLYRKLDDRGNYDPQHGAWRAQVDDYSKGVPQGIDAYRIGTNATLFSPQGGLRASVEDLMILMQAWMGLTRVKLLSEETIAQMFLPVWTFDENAKNGDSRCDQCYGRGPQIFLNRKGTDRLSETVDLPFVGHGAGAYGLLGTLGMDLKRKNGIVVVAMGTGGKYPGNYSCSSRWEEIMLTAAAEYAGFEYPRQHMGAVS